MGGFGDAHPVVDVDGVRKMIELPNMVSTQHGAGFDMTSQAAST
jgi:hypothetical protein